MPTRTPNGHHQHTPLLDGLTTEEKLKRLDAIVDLMFDPDEPDDDGWLPIRSGADFIADVARILNAPDPEPWAPTNPRQKGDDDGQEYADPRDAMNGGD